MRPGRGPRAARTPQGRARPAHRRRPRRTVLPAAFRGHRDGPPRADGPGLASGRGTVATPPDAAQLAALRPLATAPDRPHVLREVARADGGIVTLTEEQRKPGGGRPRLPDQTRQGRDPQPDPFAAKRQHEPVNVTMPV